MTGPESSPRLTDDELRAWTNKRGRIVASGIAVVVIVLLALLAWTLSR